VDQAAPREPDEPGFQGGNGLRQVGTQAIGPVPEGLPREKGDHIHGQRAFASKENLQPGIRGITRGDQFNRMFLPLAGGLAGLCLC